MSRKKQSSTALDRGRGKGKQSWGGQEKGVVPKLWLEPSEESLTGMQITVSQSPGWGEAVSPW